MGYLFLVLLLLFSGAILFLAVTIAIEKAVNKYFKDKEEKYIAVFLIIVLTMVIFRLIDFYFSLGFFVTQ